MAAIPQQRTSSPSSLTQRGAGATGTCPSCGSNRLTELGMTLTDGTPVRFQSCHECEHRSWSHEGEQLAFTDVISRATKVKV